MSTKRKEIRQAIKDKLLNETDADDRIYTSRVIPVWESERPLILVYTREETVTNRAEAPREYDRRMQLSIEIIMDGEDDIDDDLDTVGQQVETKLFTGEEAHTLEDLCEDIELKGCSMTIEKDGKKLIGSLILNYEVTYYTLAVNDPNELEYLERVDVQYDIVDGVTADNPYDIVTGLGD